MRPAGCLICSHKHMNDLKMKTRVTMMACLMAAGAFGGNLQIGVSEKAPRYFETAGGGGGFPSAATSASTG